MYACEDELREKEEAKFSNFKIIASWYLWCLKLIVWSKQKKKWSMRIVY